MICEMQSVIGHDFPRLVPSILSTGGCLIKPLRLIGCLVNSSYRDRGETRYSNHDAEFVGARLNQ